MHASYLHMDIPTTIMCIRHGHILHHMHLIMCIRHGHMDIPHYHHVCKVCVHLIIHMDIPIPVMCIRHGHASYHLHGHTYYYHVYKACVTSYHHMDTPTTIMCIRHGHILSSHGHTYYHHVYKAWAHLIITWTYLLPSIFFFFFCTCLVLCFNRVEVKKVSVLYRLLQLAFLRNSSSLALPLYSNQWKKCRSMAEALVLFLT